LDLSARLERPAGLAVCYRRIEAGESATRGREDRQLVGRELANALERDHCRSLAGAGRVVAVVGVVGMESAMGEERRSLGVEEEGSSSWAEAGIGLEAGGSWVEEDIDFAGAVGCSVAAAAGRLADLLDDHRRLRHSNLDSTY